MIQPSIYEFIKSEENKFETEEVQVGDNWYWNFRNHVQLLFHLKNGVFYTGENNWLRAFKNIMEPILNLSYWTEDLEVKDVVFFIESKYGKVLSFLVKKYHDEVYTREHDLDLLFDEITESDLDYGGVTVQKGAKRPEVLQLNQIAFCNQTDLLGGPMAIKFHFTPSSLREMANKGWGDESNGATISIPDLCVLADNEMVADGVQTTRNNKSTGKTIEVYVVRGDLPEHYLLDNNNVDDYSYQVQVVAFYTDKENKKQGVTLYRKKAKPTDILFHTSKKVHGRALGRGVGETLLHPQIWTNFLTIHKTGLLEAGSKVPLYTDDSTYTSKNKIQDMENLEITTIEDGKRIFQVPTAAPANIQVLQGAVDEWFAHGQISGSANDPILGVEQASGTTFKGQERSVAQGRGIHDRRRGQRAKFIELIYRTWIIPDIKKELLNGKKFMATLSSEELTWVADTLATKYANDKIKDIVLKGGTVTEEDKLQFTSVFKEEFFKKGNKHLFEILEGELEDIELKMGINIAGKQKNLANLSDKILSIFQFIFANPQGFQQAMQIPALAKGFEDILEYSGMNVSDFSSLLQAPAMSPIPVEGQPAELALPQANG